MASTPARVVRFVELDGFQAQFQSFHQEKPDILNKMIEFRRCKIQIPPIQLPATMRDHKLDGPLADFKECHLAGNILLVYTHANDVVTFCAVCTHEDLYGARGRKLARNIKDKLAS